MTEAFVEMPSEPFVSAESLRHHTRPQERTRIAQVKFQGVDQNFLSSSFSSFSSLARFCALGRVRSRKLQPPNRHSGLSEMSSTASEALKYHVPVCTLL